MKFNYLKNTYTYRLLFFSILFLIGCGKDEVSPEIPSISFIPQAKEIQTRASFINGSNDFNRFVVWGNYDGKAVFTQQEVTKGSNGWEYSPLQTWVLSANQYDFSAYAQIGTGTPNISNNQLSSIDINCKISQVDLIMAYTTVPKADIGKKVVMDFKHALTAVNFSFKLKEGFSYLNTYKVTRIKWGNIYTQGRLILNPNNTIISSPTGSLGEMNAITTFTGTSFTTTTAMESDFQFVIPQTQTDATLTFMLDINGESKEIVKTVAIDWEPGKRYTYSISFDPFEITIETTPWDVPDMKDIIVQ